VQERYLGRIEPDMDVCDISGDKVGTVAHVHRYEMAAAGASDAGLPREELIEIKTGFLGLGKHLYVPISAVEDVTQGCVFLSKSKDDFEGMGWDTKPEYLEELS
jgi:hypothetical protein